MAAFQSGGPLRKVLTRVLTTGALLGMYAFGTLATSGILLTAGASTAHAQRGRGRGRGGVGVGTAVGVGVGAAIVGGMIAADAANRAAAEEAAIQNCMRRFRSYNPETREYVGRDGQYHPCP